MSNNELKHYGVPGMKWGVRRNRKSASSTGGSNKTVSSKRKKRAIKIGIGVTAGILAAIGGAKLSNIVRRDLGEIKNTINDAVSYMG